MKSSALRKPVEEESSPVSRKPQRSAGRPESPYAGHFSIAHPMWTPMCQCGDGSDTLVWLLGKVASLANQRARDGSIDGWALIPGGTAQLADEYHRSVEAVNWCLNKATGGDFPLLEKKTVAEAEAEGIIFPGERGRRRGGFVLRALVLNWPKRAALIEKKREEAEKAEKAKEQSKEAQEAVSLTPEPLLLMPGEKCRPVPLTAAVKRALRGCGQFDPGELPVSLELTPVVEGDTFRLKWRLPESSEQCITPKNKQVVSDQSACCVDCENAVPFAAGSTSLHASGQKCSNPGAKPQCITAENSQVFSFVDSIFSQVGIAKAPDKPLIDGIIERLNGTPLVTFERIVRERVKQGGKFYPKLLLSLAEDARYTREVRRDKLFPVDSVPGSGGKYKYVK